MFKQSQAHQLFPVFVWSQLLEDEIAEPLNAQLIETAYAHKPADADGLPPGRGWQTRNDLQTLPELAQIVEIIHAGAQKVLEFLHARPSPIEITGMWLNVKPTGAGHPLHDHPNNYLGGVYYVKTPGGADSINFHDFRRDRFVIAPRYAKRVPQNSPIDRVTVRNGELIMFPAWLPHSVDSNPAGEERISLAFNIMFSDFTATLAKPNWEWSADDAPGSGA